LVQSGKKAVKSLNCQKHSLKGHSETKSPVNPSWSKKMTNLNTFLESSFYFLFNNLKKQYKIWYSQGKKRCQNLNCQKHSLKGHSETKSSVNLSCSKKMTVLSTFLESSLNFLLTNTKKTLQNWMRSGRKALSKLELLETQNLLFTSNFPITVNNILLVSLCH